MNPRLAISLGFSCSILVLTQTGCSTFNPLPEKDTFIPACPDRLHLFEVQDANEVVALYREKCAGYDDNRLRAYQVFANNDKTDQGKRPRFLRKNVPQGLKPIPLIQDDSNPLRLGVSSGYWARRATNSWNFAIYHETNFVGTFKLPAYEAFAPARKALLPLTAPAQNPNDVIEVGRDAAVTIVVLFQLAHEMGLTSLIH